MVKFNSTREEALLIDKIVDRGLAMSIRHDRFDIGLDRQSATMDITACHLNGCPLKLQEFLDADDFNFAHDFYGITRHLNRETGRLENYFLPRFHA